MCFYSRVLFVVQKQKFSSDATAIKWFQLECHPEYCDTTVRLIYEP